MEYFDIRCIVHDHLVFILIFGKCREFSLKDSRYQVTCKAIFLIFGKYRNFRCDNPVCSVMWEIVSEDTEDLSYPHELDCHRAEVSRVMICIKHRRKQRRKQTRKQANKHRNNQNIQQSHSNSLYIIPRIYSSLFKQSHTISQLSMLY